MCEALNLPASAIPPNPLAGDVSTELGKVFAPFASGQLRDWRRFAPVPSDWLPEEEPG